MFMVTHAPLITSESEDGVGRLMARALHDPDASVRAAAQWAYEFEGRTPPGGEL
jgi:hypothetical protein